MDTPYFMPRQQVVNYIAVLKKVRYGGKSYALCPMPYALCPMPYEHLMLLRKAISTRNRMLMFGRRRLVCL
ncbi:hypothetical protein [Microcoleus sp.]|uniref:hypothetical protein n=1 Tax=Microcoleus sp. TaxID=44472 RepID=UPI00403E89F5